MRALIPFFLFFFIGNCLSAFSGPQIETSVVFVGIARNCAKNLPKALHFIDQARAQFSRSTVFIYENDSTDFTPRLLEEWALQHTDIAVRCECSPRGGYPDYQSITPPITRFDRIARARNVYMSEIEKPWYSEFTHVIVLDLDLEDYPNVEYLRECFNVVDWDCITANGRHVKTGIYYDTFAFRNADIPLGPEVCGPSWWSCLQPVQRLLAASATGRIPVESAFGGLAIYRMEAIRGERYSSVIPDEMLEQLRLDVFFNQNAQILLSRCTRGLSVKPRLPFSKTFEESRPGSICEHVPLHFRMKKKGFNRIFIDCKLITRWQAK
jgi:hypothetical protein